MKNIRIFIFLYTLLNFAQCKSQVYSLNTSIEDIAPNGYVKDTNNELNKFTGIYKAIYQGNETTLYITKVEHVIKKRAKFSYYMDALVINYTVKNSSGIVIQNTQSNTDNKFYTIWSAPQENAVIFYYPGTNCGVGWGKVFLYKINATQLSWDYRPNGTFIDEYNCPGNQDTKVYLPVTKDLIFTKQ